MIEFRLPDVGEGLTEAEVVAWHVAAGDLVEVNDVLVEIETAKSVVELPSPAAGRVVDLHVEIGTTVAVGTVLVSIGASEKEPAPAALPVPAHESVLPPDPASTEQPLVLVGTGPSAPAGRRRRLAPLAARAREGRPGRTRGRATDNAAPTHLQGRVESTTGVTSAAASDPRETRVPVRGVRRATAQAVVTSAFTAPHVTEWLTVDVTKTMALVRQLRADPDWKGVRITPLVLVARALLLSVRLHPDVNARWDEDAGEIVLHRFVNLGIAAATPRGLLVPNIKDAHELGLRGLADAMERLVQTARAGQTQPADLAGGTITITNIGAFGVDAGTPILNPGEAAILAFGSVTDRPWIVDGQVVPRKVTQLALSFDHRLIDGELGSKVLATTGRLLADPALAFTI